MRAPLAWLRDYVDLPDDTAAIVAKLATLGFPVETVEARPSISGVVAGTIVAVTKHPNADRLVVCTLDVGAPAMLTIATAATNVAEGQIVPVARIGARLPQLTIEPRKMRGVDSQGMLCSADELGLPAEWFDDGIMQLDAGVPNGTDIVRFFGLDAPVLDVEVGANRGDALCMVGIARELAAGFDSILRMPDTTSRAVDGDAGNVRVTLESLDVRRYVAQRVTGLTVRPASAWIRIRLALAGQRPISNLVDISNFVMLELGQPLHFFDYAKIAGKHIIVRDARPEEVLTTLDGVERALDPTALVIADEARATGLAGLMGGLISEVSATTREIVIESANFAGPRIRRMSVKLGLRTEASTRNEKQLPIAFADLAAHRAAQLLALEGGSVYPPRTYGVALPESAPIALTRTDVERLLGVALSLSEMQQALEKLGFAVEPLIDGDVERLAVTVPVWRADVTIAPDLVEEIARIIGYDRLHAEIPPIAPQALQSETFDREMTLAATLAGLGYQECLTLALQPRTIADGWRRFGIDVAPVVEIRNPLSEDQRYMRFSLLPALLEHAARERAVRPLKTFELGHIFAEVAGEPIETNAAAILIVSKPVAGQPVWRDAAFLAAASDVTALLRALTGGDARLQRGAAPGLHPGKTAEIFCNDISVGFIGSVDPRLKRAADLDDDAVAALLLIDALPQRMIRRYVPLSKYPAVERDLSIIVDPAVAAGALLATIRAAELVRSAKIFDEYRGPQIGSDKKSIAVRVVLQRDDATLTDADADAAIGTIVARLRATHDAILRE